MKRLTIVLALLMGALSMTVSAQSQKVNWVETAVGQLPTTIYCEGDNHHVQGIAVDVKNGYAYFSFTTSLIKTDLRGNVLASVTGLSCHLGCIELDPESGLIYGSMEYKDDAIGQGISGKAAKSRENAFYIGIFDTKKISQVGIDASTEGVFKAVYLDEVVKMYQEGIVNDGKKYQHRYGCSGIDGISLGPQFGTREGKRFLNVALGIYNDTSRSDNDYQVLLQYDPEKLLKMAQPLSQGNLHHVGPKKADKYYFAYTGNTNWGLQNLEYDSYTGYWFACAYPGKKQAFPNYSLFMIDGAQKATKETLKGFVPAQKGLVVSLADVGLSDAKTGVRGSDWKWGSTGVESLGKGYYYFSENAKNADKKQVCKMRLYKWNGYNKQLFLEVK